MHQVVQQNAAGLELALDPVDVGAFDHQPVAVSFNCRRADVQSRCNFFDRQAAAEAEFDDASCPGFLILQRCERVFAPDPGSTGVGVHHGPPKNRPVQGGLAEIEGKWGSP